jgi:hypothetical protein
MTQWRTLTRLFSIALRLREDAYPATEYTNILISTKMQYKNVSTITLITY